MRRPRRAFLATEPSQVRECPAEHWRRHILRLFEVRLRPSRILAVPMSRRVRQKNSQAEMNDRQIGKQLVVELFPHDSTFAEQADVRELMRDRADKAHRIVEPC